MIDYGRMLFKFFGLAREREWLILARFIVIDMELDHAHNLIIINDSNLFFSSSYRIKQG